ncbi:MAG TPA: hypothetical protein VGM54_21615 [Chthoniobacter sp.]|jgi:hypothetical protein
MTYTLATFASTTFIESDFTLELPVNYTGTLVETSTSLVLENSSIRLHPRVQNWPRQPWRATKTMDRPIQACRPPFPPLNRPVSHC